MTGRPRWIAAAALLAVARAHPAAAQAPAPVPSLLEPDYLLSVGDIVDPVPWRDAETVLGSTGESAILDHSLTQFDVVYVPRVVEGRRLSRGDRLQIFRLERPVLDPRTGETLGSLLFPTGAGAVEAVTGDVARLRVTEAFDAIVVGDRVRLDPGPGAAGEGTAEPAAGGAIVAFQERKAIHPPFDRLFLRTDGAGGIAPGTVVELYRPGGARAGTALPDVVLGRAMVVRSRGRIAAAVSYELERSDLGPGDLVRVLSD